MRVTFEELKEEMKRVLIKSGFTENKAELCAGIFAGNSRDGVHSHGLNRFPVFIKYLKDGMINMLAEPVVIAIDGCMEQWDGQLAPGMYTATKAITRAAELAKNNGMGCVAVKNANHWMRGGTYGWQAADMGCMAICGTNAIANLPPWGGLEPTQANNPLVIAVPRKEGHVVLDMAMSQFSYGKLQEYELKNTQLPFPGGYDNEGQLTNDPFAIASSKRALPIGYWKGSGLSLMMDLLASCLSDGRTVKQITDDGKEYGVSQFFLCLSPARIDESIINQVIDFAKTSSPVDEHSPVRYPGEQTLAHRKKSEAEGIDVNDKIWEEVKHI